MPHSRNPVAAVLLSILCSAFLAICQARAVHAESETVTIGDSGMEVELYREFPSVRSYRFPDSGLSFDAAVDGPGILLINGELVEPVVSLLYHEDMASYTLELAELQLSLEVGFKLRGDSLQLKIGNLHEDGEFRVHSLAFRNAPMLSCSSRQGAQFAGARMYTKVEGTGDTYISLDGSEVQDDGRQGYMYAMLSNGTLSGSIWTNSTYDHPEGPTARENGRIWKQTRQDGNILRTGLWSGDWLLRAEGSDELEPAPEARIVITADANADGVVDWQDGAIAYRGVMRLPQGSQRIREQVVQRIVHNFGSQATNPFQKAMDETERMDLATAGLGQKILLKGYQSEGHDSAHPDYGGNYNERAGGLADLRMLVNHCRNANADVGVHINAQEAYPEAYSFADDLTIEQRGWSWLDQAWVIDKRHDALSGNRLRRMQRLASELPGLEFIYLDVWYQDGWESRRVAREINQQGWTLATEFPTALEYDATWYHWATDVNYGGTDLKGLHSDIARFIGNHLKDCWIAAHPLLGGAELTDFEGWQGRRDFDHALDMAFRLNLPTKWLQHFEITNWSEDEIRFSGNVIARLEDGRRLITQDGRTVLDGESYLLPWPPENPERFYYRNPAGEESKWELPADLREPAELCYLQELNDLDNANPVEIAVNGNAVALPGDSGYASILTVNRKHFCCPRHFGSGGPIPDPGFNSGGLDGKSVTASDSIVRVLRNQYGDYELNVLRGSALQMRIPLELEKPGTYAVSMDVELLEEGRRLSMSVEGAANPPGTADSVWVDQPSCTNFVAADAKHGRMMQRMQLLFDLPEGFTESTLLLDFEDSYGGEVFIDNLQCVPAVRPPLPDGAYFFEDFEHSVRGWYPFVRGDTGGASDMRTHLSERHEPFTQRGWRGRLIDDVLAGDWSLKSHADKPGVLYRTIPQNLRFEPGFRYTVSLDYACSAAGTHEILISDSSGAETVIPLDEAFEARRLSFEIEAAADGSSWFGVRKPEAGDSDLVIDNLLVEREEIEQ